MAEVWSPPVQTSSSRITVIQPEDAAGLDLLGPALAGADLLVVRPQAGEALPALEDVDALIHLDGSVSTHDDDAADWLPAVRTYLCSAVENGTATLGLGLGAQLLAVALGGEVEVDAPGGGEHGLVELRMRPDAEDDPLLREVVAELGRDVLAPSRHDDAISALPEGAVWLASSRQYPFQAFRVGSAWGLQFRPEAGADTVATWAAGEGDAVRAAHGDAGAPLGRLAEIIGRTFAELAGARVAS